MAPKKLHAKSSKSSPEPTKAKGGYAVPGRGVMYLGRIPHGFYEKELEGYFAQFGEVTRIRVSRSKKTSRSKGHAFVEFEDPDVARIAAEAMDGYMMHGRSLIAKYMTADQVHIETFKGANRPFRQVPWSAAQRKRMIENAKDPMKLAARCRRIQKQHAKKQKSLAKSGFKYEFPEVDTSK